MQRVVFDIETVGIPFEQLDDAQQKYLLKFAADEESQQTEKEKMALYPFTGEVVTIAMLNPDTNRARVLFQTAGKEIAAFDENDARFIPCPDEAALLTAFWDDIKYYDQVITFNGRGFDAPFLMTRSAIRGISATKNLMPYRYDARTHCDLMDQMSFYGAGRKFNLDFITKAFGIPSPKTDTEGVQVTALYRNGDVERIARYCLGDVIATAELYRRWVASAMVAA